MKERLKKIEENRLVEDMYTPLSVAKEEIQRRWNDKELRKKVEEYLGEVPAAFRDKPKATLFRFVATPNLEFQLAHETAAMADLDIIFTEFLRDKFCTRNVDKVRLGKMKFFNNGKEKKVIVSKNKIIDLEKSEGISFRELETVDGKNFVDFHHEIFFNEYPNAEIFDVSCFKTNGETPEQVYHKVLSLFITNGILFENYFINSNKDERRFTLEVIRPAFEKIQEIFGVRPLIVPLISFELEGDILWQCYPESLFEKNK